MNYVLSYARAFAKVPGNPDVLLERGDAMPRGIDATLLDTWVADGVVVSSDELAAIDLQISGVEYPIEHLASAAPDDTTVGQRSAATPTNDATFDIATASATDVAAHIKAKRLTIPQTVELAGTKYAAKVLEADALVTGGDPRPGVTTALADQA